MRPLPAILLPVTIAYGAALWWIVEMWFLEGSYYAHGPLVVLVGGLVIWSRREEWRSRPIQPDARGWWLLGPALFVLLCGAALTIDSLMASSLVLAVPGAALLAFGFSRLRLLWPVLWLPVLAVPPPLYLSGRLAFELKEIAITAGLGLANLFGLGASRVGAHLYVPAQESPLLVADPCGGLRSLLALTTLGYCIAFFMGPQQGARRWLLVAAAGPVAMLCNVIRIACVCWLANWWGVPFATGAGHHLMNALTWGLDLGLLVALDQLFMRWCARRGG